GGQNVNKVASKAVLRWDVAESPSLPEDVKARLRTQQRRRITAEGELGLRSQRDRDQERNRQDCLEGQLAVALRREGVPKGRNEKERVGAAKEGRGGQKRDRSGTKSARRAPTGE